MICKVWFNITNYSKSTHFRYHELQVTVSCITFHPFCRRKPHNLLAFLQHNFFHDEIRVVFSNLIDQIVFIVKKSQALEAVISVVEDHHLDFANLFVG